jgi:mannose-6-phosphate isomerase-like protein (cupin superfamily)
VHFLLERARAEARGYGMEIDEANSDENRPWGGFLRLKEESYPHFRVAYWDDVEDVPPADRSVMLAPKILLVAPHARLSLQYHHRRQEYWRCIEGPLLIVSGAGPDNLTEKRLMPGDTVRLAQGEWHRLIGLEGFGRIAEIWQHTDKNHPSDEQDIIRVEDDFGR